MAMTYKVVGHKVYGDDLVCDFEKISEAHHKIGEMLKDISSWKKICLEEFDGFDKVYDSTVWKNPFERWSEDEIKREIHS